MIEMSGFKFQLQRPREKDAATVENLGKLGPFGVVLSREEKDYQRLVSEKLKAAADWDIQESRQFCIECVSK